MATGAGKTVVMAMLIAWQTLNKVQSPRDARFTTRFLIVVPGITIRGRLNVLLPETDGNYYDLRDLIPADLKGGLERARIVITNYQAFQLKDAKEIKGVARNTRLLLKGDKTEDEFKETPKAMVSRVLRDLGGTESSGKQVMVLNDEAHHCYLARPIEVGEKRDLEAKRRQRAGRPLVLRLRAIAKHAGIKQVWDLSATPFYLSGSGYNEGYIFPWTISDFSLMDAIESGIVKVPRTPVDDDAESEHVVYLHLWDYIRRPAPRSAPQRDTSKTGYRRRNSMAPWAAFIVRTRRPLPTGKRNFVSTARPRLSSLSSALTPSFSKLIYDWIAGEAVVDDDGEIVAHKPGNLALLSNIVYGKALGRPRTILIDSAQLESGDVMKADFKAAVGAEIAAFKQEYRRSNLGADVEKITDEDLLREVMNTVGKKDKLGADSALCRIRFDAH